MKSDAKPDVCVVGLGYIGLPTAAMIARAGCKVLGVDVTQHVVDTINRGEIHIEEVDLDGLVQGVVARGKLLRLRPNGPRRCFRDRRADPVRRGSTRRHFLCARRREAVAPVLKAGDVRDPRIDLAGRHHRGDARSDRELRPDLKMPRPDGETPDISIAYCPERVLPGKILEELINNDRSIGGITPRCARKALAFYKRFVRGTCVTTDARSGGDDQAGRERLPRRQHRLRQRTVDRRRQDGARRVGSDPARQPAPARQHPPARPRRRRPLHRGRSVVHRPWRARKPR
jgi:UDP-N-acetyl-D-mannosaminuronic acid dehydrogenase